MGSMILISSEKEDLEKFTRENSSIRRGSQLHDNIASLLGFCDDCGEKILVYNYASKRSLDFYLNDKDLKLVQRLEICIGAARGLAYLHNPGKSQQRVLHRDIKSSNILLDENWNARIADFGLSKFGPANQQYTFLVSNGVGTMGYCDPLYAETGLLTKESDVYSFGVVLFEILCGRLCIRYNHDKHLTALVRKCYEQKTIVDIVYDNIKDEINPHSLKVFTSIAYQCLNRDQEQRPLMTEVVKGLESALKCQRGRYSLQSFKADQLFIDGLVTHIERDVFFKEQSNEQDGKYKHTVDLAKTTFGMRANYASSEPEIQKLWDENQFFKKVVNNGSVLKLIRVLKLSVCGDFPMCWLRIRSSNPVVCLERVLCNYLLRSCLFFVVLREGDPRKKPKGDASGSGIDMNDHLYLYSNETNGTPLINLKLTGTQNYRVWAATLKHCIHSKKKLGFINGKLAKPDPTVEPFLAEQWERCNSVMLTWILNCVSSELFIGQVFYDNAKRMWDELAETYDKVDGSVI
ncbi:protein kinase, ATP binding site-containing protein, partial [Tanacetum coccineum]